MTSLVKTNYTRQRSGSLTSSFLLGVEVSDGQSLAEIESSSNLWYGLETPLVYLE